MEGVSVTAFVTLQKIYYPLLCVIGIPGLYLFISFLFLFLLEHKEFKIALTVFCFRKIFSAVLFLLGQLKYS